MRATACLVTIAHAPSYARAELHSACGIEWMEMNLAFENGTRLPLRFDLEPTELESSVGRIRAIADVAQRNQLEIELVIEDANGVTSEATQDDLERLFRELRGDVTRGPVVDFPTGSAIHNELRRSIEQHGLGRWSDSLVALARPFLAFGTPPIVSHDCEIRIGGTKLWGLPDLPRGMPWPRQKDCTAIWMENAGLDPEAPCGFIGQLSLSELAGTWAADLLPKGGLLSFFAFTEIESVGTADALVLLTRDLRSLERRAPPSDLSEDNALRSPVALRLVERASLPETDSPHFLPLREQGVDEVAYSRLQSELGTCGLGFLGYGFTATAGDVTPSSNWHQFARLETSIGMRMDLQLESHDFSAGRLERAKLVYVHPD